MVDHVHGPGCGCREYAYAEEGDDLRTCIILENVVCLNEKNVGSAKKVFKSKEKKFDKTDLLENEDDNEILIIIPFDSKIKLKTICIIAGDSDNAPTNMKVYVNRENVDFSIADEEPTQEFQLVSNLSGDIEYATKITKFQSVNKLILYITGTAGERLCISYIGLRGENTKQKSQIVKAVYEAKPMIADHKVEGEIKNFNPIG